MLPRHQIAALFLLLAACEDKSDALYHDCDDTCERIYLESECNIQRPGRTQDELIELCTGECEEAAKTEGELGDYTPREYTPASEAVTLETDAQAEAWMDCVEETSCELLTDGYCAPIY